MAATPVEYSWTIFKAFITAKSLGIQYIGTSDTYFLWASDTVISISCRIIKDGGSDQTDFEANYQSGANPTIPAAATLAAQTQPGINIGTITANAGTGNFTVTQATASNLNAIIGNASGGSAVNIQDGGNSITVDNAGTFSVQAAATLAAETTKVIGTVNVAGSQTIGISAGSAVIGHVISDTGSTTAVTGNVASTVADGANTTLGAKADAKSTATDTTAITIMQVLKQISASVQAPPSQAVTNAGTFAVQATLSAETTKVIGTVNVASSQTIGISSGSAVIGHVIADSGSTTAVTGNVASTVADGANVTLGAKADAKNTATDTTAISIMSVLKQISASVQAPPSQAVTNAGTFAVQAASTLAAETTKVIGTVNISSSQTVGLAAGAQVIGALTANQSINTAQVNGGTTVTSVTGIQDVMPRKRTGSTGLSPNYSANRITSKTTTTPTAATAYISAITIACSAAGTAWTLVIQNKEGTPKILIPSITLTVPTTGPIIFQFAEPILMTSGIDVVTGGTTAGTVDVFVTYWQ